MYIYNPIEDCYATKKKILIFRNEINKFRLIKRKIKIFDFGCGNAESCAKYLINKEDSYYGYDIHKKSIKFANKNYSSKNIFFSEEMPKKRKFDIIIISEVLEHLENPEEILKLLMTILKDDGLILGSIPNGYGLTEIEKFIIHKFYIYKFVRFIYSKFKQKKTSKQIPFNYESGHIQFFTLSKFKMIVNNASLKISFIKNGSVMGADLTGSTIFRLEFLKSINTRLADFLPNLLSATWIFKLKK